MRADQSVGCMDLRGEAHRGRKKNLPVSAIGIRESPPLHATNGRDRPIPVDQPRALAAAI